MAKGTKTIHHGVVVDDATNVFVRVRPNEPADAAVAKNQIVFWFSGPDKIKVKHRNAAGAVTTGDVADLA